MNQRSKSLEKMILGLEQYQQLRIEDYEFQKFCLHNEGLLNGEPEKREPQLLQAQNYKHGTSVGTVSNSEKD